MIVIRTVLEDLTSFDVNNVNFVKLVLCANFISLILTCPMHLDVSQHHYAMASSHMLVEEL
jgi:hypothetical protein